MKTTIYQIIDEILYNDFNNDNYELKINEIDAPNAEMYGLIDFTVKSDEFPSDEAIREIEKAFEDYIVEVHYS